jgi:uroporphyrinogen decarboxylase
MNMAQGKREPSFERLRKALLCQGEPDYVPLVELGISPKIKGAVLGRPIRSLKDEVDFAIAAGYDFVKLQPIINLNPGERKPREGIKSSKSEEVTGERLWASEHDGIITTMEELERHIWPTRESIDYSRFEKILPYLPDSMQLIGQYGDIYTAVWGFMGFENFSFALFEEPELVERLFDKIGSLIYKLFENMVTFERVGAIWYSDDIAYSTGLMASPKALREYFFPWLKKIGTLCKERGLPFLYHSDGVLWDVFDDILEAGVNAIHPIEPKAMDIVEVKRKFAGQLCVMGNIDLGYTLTRGTPEETEAEVKERIRLVAPGGGYCLSSSNSIPEYVKAENYIAMIEATKRYGRYPIAL